MCYSSADLFVSPSRQEAYGTTIVESMACGVPSVCFGSTGSAEIIDHLSTGSVAKSWNTKDFAIGIDWLLSRSIADSNSIRQRCIDTASLKFDSSNAALKYQKLYYELLHN